MLCQNNAGDPHQHVNMHGRPKLFSTMNVRVDAVPLASIESRYGFERKLRFQLYFTIMLTRFYHVVS